MHISSEDRKLSGRAKAGAGAATAATTTAHRMRRKRQLAQVPPTNFAIANPNQLPQLDAVIIRNLTYEVGSGSKRKTILNGVNLTVPEGSM